MSWICFVGAVTCDLKYSFNFDKGEVNSCMWLSSDNKVTSCSQFVMEDLLDFKTFGIFELQSKCMHGKF